MTCLDDKVVKLITKAEVAKKQEKNELHTYLKAAFRKIRQELPDMSGFALVAWDDNAGNQSSYYVKDNSNVNLLVLPELVKMILVRDTAPTPDA